jgi:hypothetical protein
MVNDQILLSGSYNVSVVFTRWHIESFGPKDDCFDEFSCFSLTPC